MKAATLLLGSLVAASVPFAAAEAQRLAPLRAAKLVSLCENARTRVACDAYISGVADGIAGSEHMMTRAQGQDYAGATCIPDQVTAETMRSTVLDFLRGHQDLLGKPAGVPTYEALHAAYPCAGKG